MKSRHACPGFSELTSNAPPIVLHLVPVHAHLVAPDDRLEPVLFAELLRNVRAKLKANTPLARAPARVVLRVGPQHLHHEPGLARLPLVVPIKLPDIVQRDVVIGEEATVEYEVLAPYQGGKGQRREALREELEGPEPEG